MNVFKNPSHTLSIIVLMVSCHFQGSLVAQQDKTPQNDTVRVSRSGIYGLPIFFYTPETGFAGGAAALFLYHDSLSRRASNMTGAAIFTQKSQIVLSLSGDFYFDRGKSRLLSEITFQKYPNKFFGIGNRTSESSEETYTPQIFFLRAVFYRTLFSNVNIGPLIRYEHHAIREMAPAGFLASGMAPGSNGGTSSGIGIVANWDSRDNTFAAHSGGFYQLTLLTYRSAFGSDHDYTDIQIDTRTFFELLPEHIVAVQAAAEFIDGTAPFYSLVRFGGQNLIRGYYDGRYRDKNGVAVQADYRMPVWWRFGLVAFVGAAQVSDRISRLSIDQFWLAGGMGIRFALNPEERINIRLDYGAGNNSSGFYITMTEAF